MVQPTAYAHLKFKLKYLCNCLSDSDNLNYNQYNNKLSSDFQHYNSTTRRENESSFESAFTSANDAPSHTAEALTDPFMAHSDNLLLMSDDEHSVTSNSTYGNTSVNRGGAAGGGGGNRRPAGSFYEMDEEELAHHMESKYSISRKASSFSYLDNYTPTVGGGGAAGGGAGLRHNNSSTGLAGLNTVNISHISSIPNNISIATSPDKGGVALPPTSSNNNNNSSNLRGRTGSGHNSANRIKSDSSQDGINF